jgi:hypothetical protein
MVAMIFGRDYNVSERYGPGGLPALKDMLTGESSFIDVAGGAAVNISTDAVMEVAPVIADVYRTLESKVTGEPTEFTPNWEDIIEGFKEISTINYAQKAYKIITNGTIQDSLGRDLGSEKLGIQDALASALFGLSTQEIEDTYRRKTDERSARETEQGIELDIMRLYAKYYDNVNEHPEEAKKYMRRAIALGESYNFESRRMTRLLRRIQNNKQSESEKADRKHYERYRKDFEENQ